MLKKFQLKNGLKVIAVQSNKSPVVSVQMWVKTGSADEDPKVQGISHFIEHLVFKGTDEFGLGQIASTVEGSGGELNAYTTFDQTVFYVTISKNYLSTGLNVVSQMMGFPKFDETEIDNEREVVIEEIKRGNDNLHRQASRKLFETVYKKHPYGKPVIGYEKIIREVSKKQILNYYQSRYVPKNMTLVVAGDFEFDDLKNQIQKYYDPFVSHPLKKVVRKKEIVQKSTRLGLEQTTFQENLLYLAWPVPGVRHKDIPALDVLSMILGQGDSSRLNQRLRLENALVDYVGCSTFTPQDQGFFAVSASIKIENLKSVLDGIAEQIFGMLQNPATKTELGKAHVNIASEEAYSLETVDGLARKVGTYNLLFDDPNYQKQFLKAVGQVTSSDLTKIIKKYLDPKKLSLVLMSQTAIDEPLIKEWLKNYQRQWKAIKSSKALPQKMPKLSKFSNAALDSTGLNRKVLPGGITILSRANYDAPVISLRCGFRGGIRAEGFNNAGLTELLSRVWVSGTTKTPEQKLYSKVEGMASSLNAFGGRNTVGLSLTTMPSFADPMLDLLEEVLLEPALDPEVIEREKQSMTEALRTREDNASQKAILNFMKMLFKDHPYSIDPLGTPEKYHAQDLKDFLKLQLNQKNCVLSISGFFDQTKHLERLSQIYSQLPSGERFQDNSKFNNVTVPKVRFEKSEKEQSHIVIGHSGLSLTDPQRYALQIVQAVLAGQGGRLFLELRDKASLAYSVSPLRMEGTDCGYFGAYIGCSPEKTNKALKMLREEFQKIASTQLTDLELSRAKQFLIGRQHIDNQKNSALCSSVLFDEIYGLPYDESLHFAERIESVTSAEVLKAAQNIFMQPEIISVVGPDFEF